MIPTGGPKFHDSTSLVFCIFPGSVADPSAVRLRFRDPDHMLPRRTAARIRESTWFDCNARSRAPSDTATSTTSVTTTRWIFSGLLRFVTLKVEPFARVELKSGLGALHFEVNAGRWVVESGAEAHWLIPGVDASECGVFEEDEAVIETWPVLC